jgi:hypothetical protein
LTIATGVRSAGAVVRSLCAKASGEAVIRITAVAASRFVLVTLSSPES